MPRGPASPPRNPGRAAALCGARERLGWQPTQPGLLDDLHKNYYFDRIDTELRPAKPAAGWSHQRPDRAGPGGAEALGFRRNRHPAGHRITAPMARIGRFASPSAVMRGMLTVRLG
jgi:hypothetical protein